MAKRSVSLPHNLIDKDHLDVYTACLIFTWRALTKAVCSNGPLVGFLCLGNGVQSVD